MGGRELEVRFFDNGGQPVGERSFLIGIRVSYKVRRRIDANGEGYLASSSEQAPGYFEEALGILKLRAKSEGLIVDHDATEALRTTLGDAIALIEKEGSDAFSLEHQAEFATTANLLAKVATDTAQSEHALYVNQTHIEAAVEQLAELKIWPFDDGDEQ